MSCIRKRIHHRSYYSLTSEDDIRKDLRKSAKLLIKRAKKHPGWYTPQDVYYAKLIKKQNKKLKGDKHD